MFLLKLGDCHDEVLLEVEFQVSAFCTFQYERNATLNRHIYVQMHGFLAALNSLLKVLKIFI